MIFSWDILFVTDIGSVPKADSNLLIRFAYNPMGQRVEKEVIRNADTTKTLYVHDASGNIMAVYTLRNGDSLKLNDVPIYGSSRLGVWNANKVLRIDSVLHETELEEQDPQDPTTEGVTYIKAGEKQYSLSNHLDNVLATVSDRKIPVYDGGVLNHYQAEQITGNEYFAFGSLMPQRQFSIGGFRWSFNGKEFDTEINGRRNHYDYGFRILNTDLGKFLSVDPLTKAYPWYTPYQFAGNTPIVAIDLDGLEEYIIHQRYLRMSNGQPFLYQLNFKYTRPRNRVVNELGSALFVTERNDLATEFTPAFIEENTVRNARSAGNVLNNELSNAFIRTENARKDQGTQLGGIGKSTLQLDKVRLNYGDDGGQSAPEASSQFSSLDDATKATFDKMVAILIDNPNSNIIVTGVASPKASNNRGTTELSVRTNDVIARNRAEAGKTFLINYAMEKFGTEIIPDRINVVSKIQNSGDPSDLNSDLQEDRGVEFKLNN